jgi:SAM-dependent methyltransferase
MTEQNKPDSTRAWREETTRFHRELVEQRGEGWQAFWGSQESQSVRYDVFLRHLPLHGASVLDVGCGFGDFLAYARGKGVAFSRYLGVDLDEATIASARRLHPDAAFLALDLLAQDPPFVPDYIVASGIMAVRFPDFPDYVLRILQRFHQLCRAGFALNFLSTCSEKPDGVSQYTEPAWALQLFQRHISWRCVLVHDYRPNDFTLVHTRPPANP